MKTASQFAEEISAITADLDGGSVEAPPARGEPVAEEIADWRGPLQDIQVRLRRMIQQDIDKFMESAQKILSAAEKSDWSKTVVQNEVARWSRDINKVYADFKTSTQGFMDLVKSMGITTRRHSGKGKAPGRRGKMDWGNLSQTQLKREVQQQVKRLSQGIHSLADDGSFMLHQIDRILKYKHPKDETVREEIGALFQDFVNFRNAFGSKVWGPYNGLLGRLNAIPAKPISQRGTAYAKAMRQKPGSMAASSDMPYDCPELREALERDKMRGSRGMLSEGAPTADDLIESIEDEILSEADEPEKGVARKMKAKGYDFKILLKKGPPLYTKTEKGAKDVQKDYPGSKIVANESGEIDDPAVIEAAEHGDLFDFFEDFDEMLYGEENEELAEGDSDPAPFPQSEGYVRTDYTRDEPGKRPAPGKWKKQEIEQYARHQAEMLKKMVPSAAKAYDERHGYKKSFSPAEYKVFVNAFSKETDRVFGISEDSELTEMSSVVKTIFQQFGGGRSMMMIGGQARAVDANTLGVKWPSRHRARIGNYVEIKYIPGADLYDMEFFNVSVKGMKSVKKFKRLYNDQLVDTFENHTAWYLRL